MQKLFGYYLLLLIAPGVLFGNEDNQALEPGGQTSTHPVFVNVCVCVLEVSFCPHLGQTLEWSDTIQLAPTLLAATSGSLMCFILLHVSPPSSVLCLRRRWCDRTLARH